MSIIKGRHNSEEHQKYFHTPENVRANADSKFAGPLSTALMKKQNFENKSLTVFSASTLLHCGNVSQTGAGKCKIGSIWIRGFHFKVQYARIAFAQKNHEKLLTYRTATTTDAIHTGTHPKRN
ncbi:conserved hypothetical protein, partial [Trichinella spiralis]|uniref:hypothetical protein n=1 Tax=Trichinella spiralis TaxID=6334 RepID=UPI0001EFC3C0